VIYPVGGFINCFFCGKKVNFLHRNKFNELALRAFSDS